MMTEREGENEVSFPESEFQYRTVDLDDYKKSILENAALASRLWNGDDDSKDYSQQEKKTAAEELQELTDSTIEERKVKLLGELRESFGKGSKKKPPVAPKPKMKDDDNNNLNQILQDESCPKSPPPDVIPHSQNPNSTPRVPPPIPLKPRKKNSNYSQYIEALTSETGKIIPKKQESESEEELLPPPTLRPYVPPPPPPPKPQVKDLLRGKETTPHNNLPPPSFSSNRGTFPKDESPSPLEIRRKTVRDQIVRSERFEKWNLVDMQPEAQPDYLPPQKRMQTLKALPPTIVQIRRNNFNTGRVLNEHPKGFAWPGKEPSASVAEAGESGRVRGLWEQRINEHQQWRSRSYYPSGSFRRWRSVDALSASLIASRGETPISIVPTDTPFPSLPYPYDTGSLDRRHLSPRDPLFTQPTDYLSQYLNKGQSLDNLAIHPEEGMNPPPWYNPNDIKEAISHESIANLGNTRNKWEQRSDPHPPPPHPHNTGTKSGHLLYSSGAEDSANPAANNMNVIEREIVNLREREAELKQRSASLPPPRHQQQFMHHRGDPHHFTPQRDRGFAHRERFPPPPPPQSQYAPTTPSHFDPHEHRQELERQKELMLYYVKGKPEVLASLGIGVPPHLRHTLDSLGPLVPRVELVQVPGQSSTVLNGTGAGGGFGGPSHGTHTQGPSRHPPMGMDHFSSQHHQPSHNGFQPNGILPHNYHGSAHSTLERQHRTQSQDPYGSTGRYIKNTQPSQRKLSNRDRGLGDGAPLGGGGGGVRTGSTVRSGAGFLSPGESLIAKEIREAKEREEELNLSRSQLGLPTLTDILDNWREQGGMRSARSYDHLHWTDSMNRPTKDTFRAGSLDRLHRTHFSQDDDDRGLGRMRAGGGGGGGGGGGIGGARGLGVGGMGGGGGLGGGVVGGGLGGGGMSGGGMGGGGGGGGGEGGLGGGMGGGLGMGLGGGGMGDGRGGGLGGGDLGGVGGGGGMLGGIGGLGAERERQTLIGAEFSKPNIEDDIQFSLQREESLRRNRNPLHHAPSPPPHNPTLQQQQHQLQHQQQHQQHNNYNGHTPSNTTPRTHYTSNLQRNTRMDFEGQDFTPIGNMDPQREPIAVRQHRNAKRNGGRSVGLIHPTDSEPSETSSSNGDQQVRNREYVGQRNPGFRPSHTGDPFDLQQGDTEDY